MLTITEARVLLKEHVAKCREALDAPRPWRPRILTTNDRKRVEVREFAIQSLPAHILAVELLLKMACKSNAKTITMSEAACQITGPCPACAALIAVAEALK